MGSYRSLFVLTDFKGSVWVFKRPYPFLSILMGPYESSCVILGSYRFLYFLLRPYGF